MIKEFKCNRCGYLGPDQVHNSRVDRTCGRLAIEIEPKESPKSDPVVEAVRKDLLDRSNVGIQKYGTTLADNKCDLRAKLQHAYEECLDQANYLKWAIMEIDNGNT